MTLSPDSQTAADTLHQRGIAERLVEWNDEATVRNKRPLASKALMWGVWSYVLSILVVWFVLKDGGDRWWFATLMLFGPRWIYGLPLVLLVPLATAVRRRLLYPLGVSALVLVGPIMGYCVPRTAFVRSDEPAIRVVTWNVRNECVNSETLAALIASTKPDIVALQECRSDLQLDWPPDWHVHREGRLVTGSLHPLGSVEVSQRHHPPSKWPPANALRCAIQTPIGPVELVNVHLRTPRQGIEEVLSRRTFVDPSKRDSVTSEIESRRLESEDVAEWLDGSSDAVVIGGDFNMPVDSRIYRQFWSKYANAFSVAGNGFGHTKRTEVLGWQYGSRIDHILTAPGWRPCGCWLGPNLGSDHLPLIADLVPVRGQE